MSDAEPATTPAPTSPKKAAKTKAGAAAKKPRVKPTHPKTADMVNAAIKDLKERGGSSLQAIKKYISANYKVDAEKLAPFIRKYLKSAVTTGSLVQTKGKGASGSFKLAGASAAGDKKSTTRVAKPKTAKAKSPAKAQKTKAATASKKSASPKKVAAKKSPSTSKKIMPKSKSASPTKNAKSPTKKPKAPKPKKATKAKSPKKAAPKKK